MKPLLYWMRRDFRLADNAALTAALETGRPVIPVFICDEVVERHGAAPKFRLGAAVETFSEALEARGGRLILRRGEALACLKELIEETGAEAVFWNRLYDPESKSRDTEVKSALKSAGVEAKSFAGHLLFEPWTVETKTGGFYKVFTPMWKMVRSREVAPALPVPEALNDGGAWPEVWPASDGMEAWSLDAPMRRGAPVLAAHMRVGEQAASARLDEFIADIVHNYDASRDLPAVDGTSRLSENLTYGEISPATCWHAGWRALQGG